MVRRVTQFSIAALLVMFVGSAQASVLLNGDFASGVANWTSYTTANGTITEIPSTPGAPVSPQVATTAAFDVTGGGASSALFLNAGAYLPPYGTTQQGGGVFQSFTTTGGLATFSADIAAFTRTGNLSLGVFSVLLDGQVLDTFDFADGLAGATERSTLDFSTLLSAGTHEIRFLVTRPFGPGRGVVAQYIDNVSLDVTAAVPEASTWAMIILGFGGLGAMASRRARRKAASLGAA